MKYKDIDMAHYNLDLDHFVRATFEFYGIQNIKPVNIWYNGLNTTCEFAGGEKITVSPSEQDKFDPEIGVAMCIMKKLYGSRGAFQKAVSEGNDQTPDRNKNGEL